MRQGPQPGAGEKVSWRGGRRHEIIAQEVAKRVDKGSPGGLEAVLSPFQDCDHENNQSCRSGV